MKRIVLIFFAAFSFLVFFASGIVESQDGLQYLAIARQIYYHQTFEMPAAKYPQENIHMNVNYGVDGQEFSPTGLGFSLAYLPAVFMEDVFNRLAEVQPTAQFPLDNDWPIMLFASMTNAFFAALFITVFYLYLRTFRFSEKKALLLSFVLFICSNLFVYSKHGFAHMLFLSFMLVSFYCIRKYGLALHRFWLVLAGMSYGVIVLSYNPTYLLLLPGLGLYLIFQYQWQQWQHWRMTVLELVKDCLTALAGLLPFAGVYFWFNMVRFGGFLSSGYGTGGIPVPPAPQPFVLFEGLWGILFSPGKSIFLFSPILLLLIIFWFKFKQQYLPEIVAALSIFVVYLYFIASLVGGADFFPWHGEASFGPRYLLPILPLFLILVALLYKNISHFQKKCVFWPLVTLGIVIQLVGVVIPYQVRFAGMEYQINLNGHRITYNVYANFIPRFSPLYSMAKWSVRKALELPRLYVQQPKVLVADGVHGVLETSEGSWRQLESTAAFFLKPDDQPQNVTLHIRNHVATSSATAYPLALRGVIASGQEVVTQVPPGEAASIAFTAVETQQKITPVIVQSSYNGTDSAQLNTQHTFLTGIAVNNQPIPIQYIAYPYVSPVSERLFNVDYYYWGKLNNELWDIWNMRSIVYVHTFDLWWLKPLHYWDLPKHVYAVLLLLNTGVFVSSSYALLRKQPLERKAKVS
ncbi:MAG: hypothetical protein WDZ94_02160 [Patescibacteria group bacterium]